MTTHHSDPVRAAIRTFRSYTLLAEEGPPLRAKLDFNESPFDVPQELKDRVLSRLGARRWSEYPAFGSPRVKRAVADSIGRSPDEIVLGSGSGEVILAAMSVFSGSGGSVLLTPPTFSLYTQMAAIAGAQPYQVARKGADFEIDEPALFAALKGDDQLVPLICSPNNPTGGVCGRALIEELSRRAPVVLLDQAYIDFSRPEDDALPLLATLQNLVIFRTLSKAFSAAGFRIGYAVARPGLAREIEKAVLPFSIDLAAEELALAVLEQPETSLRTVSTVVAERERLRADLLKLGATVASSQSNFLFFAPPGGQARELRAKLLERGVLVRDMTHASPDRLRVTVGSPEQNDTFLQAMKESL